MTIPIAQIVNIDAPASAPVGEQVIVDVSVKNNSTDDFYLGISGVFDSTSIVFQFDYLLVSAGQTVVFRGTFTMPSNNIRVTIWSWYWDTAIGWVLDVTDYVDITLAALAQAISAFQILDYLKV